MEPVYTPAEAARFLKVSASTVYRLADTGQLECYRWQAIDAKGRGKRTIRFNEAQLERFLKAHYVIRRNNAE